MRNVDVAEARNRRRESCVLDFGKGDARLIAVLDGAGSWGTGQEAASWVRDALRDRWQGRPPENVAALSADLAAAAAAIPEELRDSEFGDDFSFAAALLSPDGIHVAAAGHFGALRVSGDRADKLLSPGTWVMEQVSAGILTVDEALRHPLRQVCTGPHVSSRGADLFVNEPIQLEAGESILILELSIFQELLRTPVTSWKSLSAKQLQALPPHEDGPAGPVIRVFENAPAA